MGQDSPTDKSSMKPKVLLIEDDKLVHKYFQVNLPNCDILTDDKGVDPLFYPYRYPITMAFIDLHLPKTNGHEIIKKIHEYDESIPIVVISSTTDIKDAIEAYRNGVTDFLTKPLDVDSLQKVYQKCLRQKQIFSENLRLNDQLSTNKHQLIVGKAPSMLEIKSQLSKLKNSFIDVLIVGESGAGKEVIAKSLHQQEEDETRPYITLNCSAIPRELIESVLFGHEKGSFTGAHKKQLGKFELAHGGDIFLDEIGTLPLDLQAKLLRVLQEREIEPIGLGQSKKVDVRVIAATNEDLIQMVKDKKFRKDLYYRLNKVIIELPPLRDRKEDIPDLIQHFLKKHTRGGIAKLISDNALKKFIDHTWPGNIRELENVIENLVITSRGRTIQVEDLRYVNFSDDPFGDIDEDHGSAVEVKDGIHLQIKDTDTLDHANRVLEEKFITRVLNNSATKQEAASKLGIDRKTLFRKIKLYGIES